MKNENFIELLEEYKFDLPEELIAKYPPENRGDSRLLVIHADGRLEDAMITDLSRFLPENSILVKNTTKVSRRRVYLFRKSGARIEALFLNNHGRLWECLLRGSGKLKENETLVHPSGLNFIFSRKKDSSSSILYPCKSDGSPAFMDVEDSESFFENFGEMPIPPYLKRNAENLDKDRYQTVYAESPGSIAAPTAGLHLTGKILDSLKIKNIRNADLELRIGYGTFAPLLQENFNEGRLHEEIYTISRKTEELLNQKENRVFAVGTTTLRALESNYREFGYYKEGTFATSLFVYPPDTVHTTDGLLTNFHLPESSLFLLVCAYRNPELLKKAYRHAVAEKYRFFSYGDAMLILRDKS